MSGKKLIGVTDSVQQAEEAENPELQSQRRKQEQSRQGSTIPPSDGRTIYKVSPVFQRLGERVKAFFSPGLYVVLGHTRLQEFLANTHPDILLRLRTIYLIPELPTQSPSNSEPSELEEFQDSALLEASGHLPRGSKADDTTPSEDPEPCHLDPVFVSRLLYSYQLTQPEHGFIIGLIAGAILTIAIGTGAFFLEPLL